MERKLPLELFKYSILKQRKYREIVSLLGSTGGEQCLDIGGDNGVISYLLRARGGAWKSVDLDERTVRAIRALVETEVYRIDGEHLPFEDATFDTVVIVDFLEHIPDDRRFVEELHRVMKPAGRLIVNVPHHKESLLRRFRLAIGQSDEKHGHLRPGYTADSLRVLLEPRFRVTGCKSYSKFFSEWIDTMITFAQYRLRGQEMLSRKGNIVTGSDLNRHLRLFRIYRLLYPVLWLFAQLDRLLFFRSGYSLIASAQIDQPTGRPVPSQQKSGTAPQA